MATPPVIRDTQQSTWSDAGGGISTKTITLSIQSGDMIVVRALTETSVYTLAPTNDGSALTWDQAQMFGATGNQCRGYIWTATGDSTRSLVITLTASASNISFGGIATSFSAHNGLGPDTGGANTGGPPSLTLACSANSWVGCIDGDWNAGGGADTWLTNAGAFTERVDYSDPAKYDVYAGDHLDCGAAATYTLGMSAPDPQNWSLGAIEVLGTAGGAAITDVAFTAQLEQVGNRRLSPGLIGPGKDTFGDFS